MINKQFKLNIELVPSTIWYANIYNYYKKNNKMEKWHELKEHLFETEGNKCWICGKENKDLEAHEFWEYDDYRHIQKLSAIHHLCGLCHKIKHIGLWLHTQNGERMLRKQGIRKEDIINHFCKVNNCSLDDFYKHENEAFSIFEKRSKFQWKQDLGMYDPKHELKLLKSQQKLQVAGND
jgi:hypothetical protein